MQIVYAAEEAPASFEKSIFLAGPSPRSDAHLNWRPDALKLLEEMGYDGVVFVPLPRDGKWNCGFDHQVEWEKKHLDMSDVVVFWVPRDMQVAPALTTNVEFGMYYDAGKTVLGYPPEAYNMRYLAHRARLEGVPVESTLQNTLLQALERTKHKALRFGGERSVPLHIWHQPAFRSWHAAQRAVGNRLDGAQLLWSFRIGPNKAVTFCYALKVDVYVAAEKRNKTNEFIFSRPDVFVVVAYHRPDSDVLGTRVALVKEFRSSVRNNAGFVYEAPGGSSLKLSQDARVVAAHELEEEMGINIDPTRLRYVGSRQMCAALSTHHGVVYAVELTALEMNRLEDEHSSGVTHGIANDTELTYVEVYDLDDLVAGKVFIDWSMLGIILAATSGSG